MMVTLASSSPLLLLLVTTTTAQIVLDSENTAIDFSGGTVDEDGVLCVDIEEEVEVVEQGEEQQCAQQNVTQCFTDYVTQYTDEVREKCEEQFVKTCRIVMRDRAYN